MSKKADPKFKKDPKTPSKKCGAKTRSGKPCERYGMKNGRCPNHGGCNPGAPKGSKNAEKHGLYSKYETEENKKLYDELLKKPLNLMEEIASARLTLFKIKKAQSEWESFKKEKLSSGNDLELTGIEIKEYVDESGKKKIERKKVSGKPDYNAMEARYTRLISDLQIKQKELALSLNDENEFEKAQRIKSAFDDLMKVVPSKPDE